MNSMSKPLFDVLKIPQDICKHRVMYLFGQPFIMDVLARTINHVALAYRVPVFSVLEPDPADAWIDWAIQNETPASP